MGRTVPSFRLTSIMEEKDWNNIFTRYLNKNDKPVFKNMFSVSTLYNNASSYCANPLRLYPILYSIAFHQYKSLKIDEKNGEIKDRSQDDVEKTIEKADKIHDTDITKTTTAINDILFPYANIVTKEIESWKGYADCLGKKDRIMFYHMLKECYKYSDAIHAKGQEQSTNSILMSILFEIYKMKRY